MAPDGVHDFAARAEAPFQDGLRAVARATTTAP
jgi:hypothetical protein